MIERVTRSLTLLRVFVVLSALVLGVGGLALASLVASAIRDQAVEDRESAVTQYVDGVLGRELVQGDRIVVAREPTQDALRRVHNRHDILSVKVWRPDGVLAWTDTDALRIGRDFKVSEHLHEALNGQGEAELENLSDGGEHAGEDIPLLAAIVGLADAWDAMTTERPYAPAMPADEALEEIRRGMGTQFAPAVAQAMLRLHELEPVAV